MNLCPWIYFQTSIVEENNFAKCGASCYNTLLKASDLIFIRNGRTFFKGDAENVCEKLILCVI